MTATARLDRAAFLPTTLADVRARGWAALDVIIVSGDAYVDHPSFGPAIIGRVLEREGYKVGILAQPDWRAPEAFKALGTPRLFFGVTAGNIDSMLNHYTAAKLPRSTDQYSQGGRVGLRPNRASLVYCQMLRRVFGRLPIVLGGVEASLRRFAHYDYWADAVRRSVLIDAGADLLVYGMGERAVVAIADRLQGGWNARDIHDVDGTCFLVPDRAVDALFPGETGPKGRGAPFVVAPSMDEVQRDKRAYARAFRTIYLEQDPRRGRHVVQPVGNGVTLVQRKPAAPLSTREMDAVYDLRFLHAPHPDYDGQGSVPAFRTTEHSIVSHRGCVASCSFCTIYAHQGRHVQSRSRASIVAEAERLARMPGFRGHVTDIGGPTANMWGVTCVVMERHGACKSRDCLLPEPCKLLKQDDRGLVDLYRAVRAVPGVRQVSVQSGVRYDLALVDSDRAYLRELVEHHVSGQLKVAPEHTEEHVLALMNKPPWTVFQRFKIEYERLNRTLGREQYLVEYFISSHPGTRLQDMIEMACRMEEQGIHSDQVQDFIPTPLTLATCMFHTGLDPMTMQPVYTDTTPRGKRLQRALLHYKKPENRALVIEALTRAGRQDLVATLLGKPLGAPRSPCSYERPKWRSSWS